MANKATKSLTTGMKVLGGANIPTYTLEYLAATKKKKQGEFETIVVPYIELGRDSNCGIRFGDDTPTVSRKHAAISRENDETKILNLSKSNPTLVNGRPVKNQYYLNNGDEIQLSLEGPRLRYNTTKSGTAKIGFTSKMNLVMQQSIRPYKMAAVSFLLLFVIITSASGYAIYSLMEESDRLVGEIDRMENVQDDFLNQTTMLSSELERQRQVSDSLLALPRGGTSYVQIIEPLKKYVLGIFMNEAEVTYSDGNSSVFDFGQRLNCTGFLIEGGTFVTAKHCFDPAEIHPELNIIHHNGGRVNIKMTARSYDGSIEFDFSSEEMIADYSTDEMIRSEQGLLRNATITTGYDWGYMETNYIEGLKYDKELSANLSAGTELIALGYSYGDRYRTDGNLEPYFTNALTTLSGLTNRTIHVAQAGWGPGNSGGPIFANIGGEAITVGIVAGTYLSDQRERTIQIVTPLINL